MGFYVNSSFPVESIREDSEHLVCFEQLGFFIQIHKEVAMATMRKMRTKYYSRISWRDNGSLNEIVIPLKTDNEKEARTRLQLVENEEKNIQDGILQKYQFARKFPWLNPEGISKYEGIKLKDVIPEYLKHRRLKFREGTVERDYYSLKQLVHILGENKDIQSITYKDMEEKFIPYYKKKGYAKSGINISCRTIKVFFSYLLKEKLIPEKISFQLLPVHNEPCYINRAEIEALHEIVDNRMKRFFYFYEMTGCRGSDPFKGTIENNVWRLSPDEAKTKHWHYYKLTDELAYIWLEFQDLKQSYIDSGKSEKRAIKTGYQFMQKNMYRAIKELRKANLVSQTKKLTLKSFRHTFGIIDVTMYKDIWSTSKKMNHAEIGVTQQYLDLQNYFDLSKEFPELKPYLVDTKPKFQGEGIPQHGNAVSPLWGGDGNALMETKA